MDKITIVINGKGGSGKDTLIEILAKTYKTTNVSAITPAKKFLEFCGWDGVKTEAYRKFLSDLKQLMTDFNNYPTKYLLEEQKKFLNSDNNLLFVHIREPEEIEKFVAGSVGKTFSLLVRPREELKDKVYGNKSDDEVENYDYSLIYENIKPLGQVEADWLQFFEKHILN